MSMSLAIAFSIVGAFVGGVWPGAVASASQAANRFIDVTSYPAAVGGGVARVAAASAHGWDVSEAVGATAIAVGSLGLATAAIRITASGGLRLAAARPLAGALHRAHSGHIGDYVVWLFAGLAALTVLLRLQVG